MSAIYPIFQHAYFVNDVEEAARKWHRLYGAGPFVLVPHHKTEKFQYRGTLQEADVSYAFGYSGDAQIQLIEQHDDTPSIYRDMYEAGTYGHHHVARLVPDYPSERARMAELAGEPHCELFANDIVACYFDTTPQLGYYTELHSITDRILATFARWKDAHDRWDGTGSPIRSHESGT